MYQINTLCTSDLHNGICQLYLNINKRKINNKKMSEGEKKEMVQS